VECIGTELRHQRTFRGRLMPLDERILAMNFRNRISRILGLIDYRESEASEIGLAMAADRIVDDNRGYPILPPDLAPGEELVWAEQTLMRCSFEDGLEVVDRANIWVVSIKSTHPSHLRSNRERINLSPFRKTFHCNCELAKQSGGNG